MNGEVLISESGLALLFNPGRLITDRTLVVANLTNELIVLERLTIGELLDEPLGVVIGPQSSGEFWPRGDLGPDLTYPVKLTLRYLRGEKSKELTVPVIFGKSEGGYWGVTHA